MASSGSASSLTWKPVTWGPEYHQLVSTPHESTPPEHPTHPHHSSDPAEASPGDSTAKQKKQHSNRTGGPGGHGEHGTHDHANHVAQYRRLFWIMLGFSVPVVGLSHGMSTLLGYELPHTPIIMWLPAVLGTVMYLWGGWPFLRGAVTEITALKPGMMLLVALAITVAFISSWLAQLELTPRELDFWWELALLIVIMLLGHWLEMRSLAHTSSALQSLAGLLPDTAEKVAGDTFHTVSPAELRPGDRVIVRPGGRVPADGVIERGDADIDESMITGESRPVHKKVGGQLVAGAVAINNALRIRITAVGDNTTLAGIQRLVAHAQQSSSRAQRLADRAAGWLFWFALVVSAVTAAAWSFAVGVDAAVIPAITVLVIACPHALGLAIPLVVSISTELGARNGILVKDRLALETMRTVDTVIFDKTGTLTKGRPAVTDIATTPGHDHDQVLALAAAAEHESEHPFARAIVRAAQSENLPVPVASDFQASPGNGVTATVDDADIRVGGPGLLEMTSAIPIPETRSWSDAGSTVLHVMIDNEVAGAIRLDDDIRPESFGAVDALHHEGITVAMLTGDHESVAKRVGAALGIDRVIAGVRPEDKAQHVEALQREGRRVAMVGDGVNDSPALATADVGLAIGAGTDVAIASAGVILASDDPRAVLAVRTLSALSYRKMKQNLSWAAGYNIVAIPLAAGILAPIGFVLPMAVGAFLMSVSTVVVAVNAQLLRRVKLSLS